MKHMPVLLNECIDGLNIKPDGIYVDGTFNMRSNNSVVFNNNANSSGGGIYFNSGANFRIEGGTVYGNEIVNGIYRNYASSGVALFIHAFYGSIEYGIFNPNWISNGSLTTQSNGPINTTIRVVDGQLQ